MADKRQGINLDDLEIGNIIEEAPNQKPKDAPPSGPAHVVRTKPAGVNAIFDKHKKMIFLFDVSGSMGEGMLPDDIDNMWVWTEEKENEFITALRSKVDEEFKRNFVQYGEDEDAKFAEIVKKQMYESILIEEIMLKGTDPDDIDEDAVKAIVDARFDSMDADERAHTKFQFTYGFTPEPGQKLRQYVVRKNLDRQFGIYLHRTAVEQKSASKMDVLKKAAKQFIEDRFEKHPDAQMIVYKFDHQTALVTENPTKDQLLFAVDNMYPAGGTNIYRALTVAIEEFKRAPSAVKSHQIVLVTDAESSEGAVIKRDLLPELKKLGVVLDFILVKGREAIIPMYNATTAIAEVCKELSGEYVEVNTPDEFGQKFFAAASRLCLPPANL